MPRTKKRTKKRCCRCSEPSLPGLVPNPGYCQYHYNEFMWGTAWADLVRSSETKWRELRALERET